MSTLLFQGNIVKVTTRRDRTVSLTLESSLEMNDPQELASLFSLKNDSVYVAIKEGNFTNEDIESIPEPEAIEDSVSPAMRLRGCLYRWWEQKGRTGDFESFYRVHMARLAEQIKEKLT